MDNYINYIYTKIEILNSLHAKKLKKNIAFFDDVYFENADAFFVKYINHLSNQNKGINYAIDCYLHMIEDMNFEGIKFLHTGMYSSSTFIEVNKRVYSRPEIMEYYMHGLIMSQFLWKHHYQMLLFFIDGFVNYAKNITKFLEIGAGHGLYLLKALDKLNNETEVTAVDISQTSIEFSKQMVNDSRVNFKVLDIFDFDEDKQFDFITMGEVLEHVENPFQLLKKLGDILTKDGMAFITTPTNAPAIDHIYLFSNIDEIKELIHSAGFVIVKDAAFSSEDLPLDKIEKYKIAILYGAFIKKI